MNRGRISRNRHLVQGLFFVLIALIAAAHSLEEAGITIPIIQGASLHAVCPFGGVVTIYELVASGGFVQKIHESSLILGILVMVSAVFFGPVFCGWICPFGTFQEIFSSLGKKLFRRRFSTFIPKRIDRYLRYLRYAVLLWVLIMTAVSAQLVFASYDPYYALFNFWTGEVAVSGFIVLGLVLVLSLFTERPFCKYACPYGAFLGLTNLLRIFPIRREESTCINCSACDRACPMNIEVSKAEAVRDHQCISCLACTSEEACPIKHTVYSGRNRKNVISARTIAVVVPAILFIGIIVSMLLGYWQTESSKVPRLISEGELAGAYDPADIRGSYMFSDIEESFGVPAEIIAEAYGFEDPEHAAKEVGEKFEIILEGSDYDIGTDSVRWFVSLYLGYPYEPEETTLLTEQGLVLLYGSGRITDEQYNVLMEGRSYTVPADAGGLQPEPEMSVEDMSDPVLEIKGKTTFREILETGVSLGEIEDIVGFEVVSEDLSVRDACLEQGIEFSEVRESLQGLVDRL